MEVQINYFAVFLAALSSMAVGAIWYSKSVFGKQWMKMTGLDEKKASSGATTAMTGAFLVSLLQAYIVAHVMYISEAFYKVGYVESGLNTGFFLWLGLALPVVVVNGLFEQRRKKLIAINAGYQLATLLVMGLIIGLMY